MGGGGRGEEDLGEVLDIGFDYYTSGRIRLVSGVRKPIVTCNAFIYLVTKDGSTQMQLPSRMPSSR